MRASGIVMGGVDASGGVVWVVQGVGPLWVSGIVASCTAATPMGGFV